MKKSIIISTFAALAIVSTSCNPDLLNIPQMGVTSEETFYVTDEDCEQATAAVYNASRKVLTGKPSIGSYENAFFLKNLLSDDIRTGSTRTDQTNLQQIWEMHLVTTNDWFRIIYDEYYSSIYLANLVLEKFNPEDSEIKARNIAECRGLRALSYYDLVTLWGRVPLVTKVLKTADEFQVENTEIAEIWKFIESGTDDVLGGGIYWCEQKKGSKNTCSNAPGSVYATKLYMATANPAYLAKGIELYNWTKSNLLDTSDYLYFDNVNLEGKVARQKYSYNSGQMIQAACLIYNITKDQTYLDDARRTAAACYGYYFEDWTAEGGAPVKVLKKGNVWFHAVMLRGLIEFYRIDGDPTYIDAVRSSLDVAWNHGRSAEGLFGEDCRTPEEGKKWLLTQGAMAEMYARIAAVGRSR